MYLTCSGYNNLTLAFLGSGLSQPSKSDLALREPRLIIETPLLIILYIPVYKQTAILEQLSWYLRPELSASDHHAFLKSKGNGLPVAHF